ncbi:hypothetical protein G7Y79_00021g050520 [Physcia stellaris]|nr:hypothetical protein G7Y79_00021g050520 [Physcia stellaris]
MSKPPPTPHQILAAGIIANSIPQVQHGIDLLSNTRRGFEPLKALRQAIMHCQPEIVRYLLAETGATVEDLPPRYVYYAMNCRGEVREEEMMEMERVERTWDVLVEEGWDVNFRGRREVRGEDDNVIHVPEESLLTLALPFPRLVSWCLAHGASVLDPPDLHPLSTPPLLEAAASKASLDTFQLLQQRGAQLTRRVLHRAVEAAAYGGGEGGGERMALVKYLVEELGCDVNALDVEPGKQFPNHWGTPMGYAVHVSHGGGPGRGREVVGFLLEKGADPTIKDCWDGNSPLDKARKGFAGKAVIEVLEEWERRQEKDAVEQ